MDQIVSEILTLDKDTSQENPESESLWIIHEPNYITINIVVITKYYCYSIQDPKFQLESKYL